MKLLLEEPVPGSLAEGIRCGVQQSSTSSDPSPHLPATDSRSRNVWLRDGRLDRIGVCARFCSREVLRFRPDLQDFIDDVYLIIFGMKSDITPLYRRAFIPRAPSFRSCVASSVVI